MKIILASKYYYRRGGLESYYFKTKELLESQGHQVIPFSTDYYENYESEYSKYFCAYHDLSKIRLLENGMDNLYATANMFFNREAYNNMKKLIKDTKPDLLQGFGITKHLSYSIFRAAKEMGVPTIMRLSDYAILCPNSTATDGMGKICYDFSCSKGDFVRALKTKCIHDSRLASLIGNFEVRVNLLLDVYKKYIDYFIAPSKFIRNIFIQHLGISPQRIIFLPIFVDPINDTDNESDDGYFLFAGRLNKEKGVKTLLDAFSRTNEKLVIAGKGPEELEFKKYAQKIGINAEFVGFQDYESLQHLIKKCRAVIIPSEWYENSPNIILEAYCHGKPVIASRIGGIPELIEDNKTGFLFEMGNVEDLAEKINLINRNKNLAAEMGRNSKKVIIDKFNPGNHYKNLLSIYMSAIRKKVLLVNNFYYNRGGDCTYLFGLKKLLERKGHNVIIFSMNHPLNVDSIWSKYFVNYINYDEEVKKITIKSGIRVASRTIYFLKAKKMIDKLIREERPDIAHLHNIHHHITPSILYALRKHTVPVIWTLHDYQLICPNISFLAHGKICERCKNHKYYSPLLVRCKKSSFTASLMSVIEITLHNIMGVNKLVNKYIAPSEFLRNKFIEYDFNQKKLCHLNSFVDINVDRNDIKVGDYILFIGRISEEKGLKTLIDAAININTCKLKIVGSGPLHEQLITYANSLDKNMAIEFLGKMERAEVIELLKNCKFLVVPSEWYENLPFVIMEAFACGKPVIGSNIGGIKELIKDNQRGLLFEPKNSDDLAQKIRYFLDHPDIVLKMGEHARTYAINELNVDIHYQEIIKIYNEACKRL